MNHRFENALVLSGGSIKGAFQAGAIEVALEQGFVPDAIYGISVGSLNGAFLADRAGRAILKGRLPDWPAIGRELVEFWTREIKSSEDIARKKGFLGIAAGVLFKNWGGLSDTTPLRNLIKREISLDNIRKSPVYFACGATNLNSGEIFYADFGNSGSNLIEFIFASSAIPFFMPQVPIKHFVDGVMREEVYIDGAGRDSSPLSCAIEKGAVNVLGIYCHPLTMDLKHGLDYRRFMTYTERVMDILSNEQINNDHKIGVLINALITHGAGTQAGSPLAGKRVIHGLKRVIRPEKEIPFRQDEITPEIVAQMIAWGKRNAMGYFQDIVHDVEDDPRGHAGHAA
jgi:NTE family protein